ncbi:MAG: GDP-L-fucose synthase family protein [Acidimicrobiia bacterium]
MTAPYDLTGKRLWVAGHRGLVGSALVRRVAREPIEELITATSAELDLRRQEPTEAFVARTRPEVVILAAARVGGINANRLHQGEFLYDNLMIAANVIEVARRTAVEKLVVLGSSCIYPREAPQPMPEDALLTGPLEPTNEGYAIAKIAALELAKLYRRQHGMNAISLQPTNLYGPDDNFDLASSHVLAALLRKIHEAKVAGSPTVEIWGTGSPRREFLHVDDLADATFFALVHYEGEQHLNVGAGEDISVRELAELIAEVVGWRGEFAINTSMPDGTPRKLLDVSRLASLGWKASIGLREGIQQTYRWYLEHIT